jgi:peptide/nickel transport system ATP-binding protein
VGEPLLRVNNLRLYYSTMRGLVRAVDLVSFEVGNLETLAIVGESGSGKSSTAHAIIRILPRNVAVLNGSIVFDGVEINKLGEEEFRRRVRGGRHIDGVSRRDELSQPSYEGG